MDAKKILYYAGFISVLAYLTADIIGGIITPGYSYIMYAVSELIQSGAENRLLLSPFILVHGVMGFLFGIGILLHHPYKQSKLIFIGGSLYTLTGISSSLTGTIFPMDPIGAQSTFPGIMHLVLLVFNVLLIFPALLLLGIGCYKLKDWNTFRIYTFITVLIIFISGVLSGVVIANQIPIMGVIERLNVYSLFLWICVLAYKLIRENREIS